MERNFSPFLILTKCPKGPLASTGKSRTPEEKKEFVELFTTIMKDAYIGKTDTYSGEKVVIVSEKQDKKICHGTNQDYHKQRNRSIGGL